MIRGVPVPGRRSTRTALLIHACLALLAVPVQARQAPSGPDAVLASERYLTPPAEVAAAVLAPRHEDVLLSDLDPSGRWFLRTIADGAPPLEVFATRHYDLGDFRIDPAANRARNLTLRSDVGYQLIAADGSSRVSVQVPRGARVSGARWSPDGSRLAYFAHFDDASHVYVAEARDGRSRQVTRTPLLATRVTSVEWTPDGGSVVAVLLPEERGPEPPKPAVPETPMVRLTTEGENRLRVFFDLLESPHEMELVEYYATGQLALIEVESRRVRPVGEPEMIQSVSVSPDGAHLRVTRMVKPFSYIVPVNNFGNVEEIWDLEGRVLATVQEQALRDGRQGDGGGDGGGQQGAGGNGRRNVAWRVDGPGLVYLQLEPRDERGGAEQEEQQEGEGTSRKDRVVLWLPPFDSSSTEVLHETEDRIDSFRFDDGGRTLFLTRTSGSGGSARQKLSAVFLDDPAAEHVIYEHRTADLRAEPGSLMTVRGTSGETVARTTPDGGAVYLSGTQYFEDPTEEAPRPFVDRVDIRSGAKERIFQSAADVYETVSAVLDEDFTRVVVSRQSRTLVPDSWLVDLGSGQRDRLTNNVDHTPEITAARRETVMITRPDGFRSRVQVTLPAGYSEGTRLPAMFWFYPREYTEQERYDEATLARYNKNTFPRVNMRSMDILTLLGYAVVDPDLPIVGDQGQMNNNYVQDLRNTLATVIDSLEARGWIDRGRLGIGGHSYGGFGTVNAMVHTPFFKAGIAGDGNYNRTLTPIGFQSERRELWDAPQVYLEMSPFMYANRLTGALLLYHGMDDHNVGTHPIHSERLFHALNALGKTAALYMYPYEDHGPATEETLLDMWARWTAWLDKHVMNAGREGARMTTEEDSGSTGR